jgi:hypothetical protein
LCGSLQQKIFHWVCVRSENLRLYISYQENGECRIVVVRLNITTGGGTQQYRPLFPVHDYLTAPCRQFAKRFRRYALALRVTGRDPPVESASFFAGNKVVCFGNAAKTNCDLTA